jgi:hypothetical protein
MLSVLGTGVPTGMGILVNVDMPLKLLKCILRTVGQRI